MQQLLTGKKRLPGFGRPGKGGYSRKGLPNEWDFERIGNVAEEVADRNKGCEEVPVLSCSKYDGFVDSLKYFKKKVYSDDTSNYKLIRCGEFGFPANHVEEGSIGLQSTHDKGIVSPIYVVFRVDPSRIDPFFLYKVLKVIITVKFSRPQPLPLWIGEEVFAGSNFQASRCHCPAWRNRSQLVQ